MIAAYLQENNIQALSTPEGLFYRIEKHGPGPKPKTGDHVVVHYTGRLLNGQKFDSSHDRGQPFAFEVGKGQVIAGWDKGVPLVGEGGKITLFVPPELGYGSQGAGGVIPPNAGLIFEVEVLQVLDPVSYQTWQKDQEAQREKAFRAYLEKQLAEDFEVITQYVNEQEGDFERTRTGVHYQILESGEGAVPQQGQQVSIHYTGSLLDGTVFDSSYQRQQPISFPMGGQRVIPGFEEAVALLKVGGKGAFVIPSPLAYGPKKVGDIPENSVLRFDIELIGIQ